jgi:transposase-like protein
MDRDKDGARIGRLEVVETGRRRRWSEDEKLRIVLESLQGTRQVSATALRYSILRSLLLKWRRLFRAEQNERKARAEPINPSARGIWGATTPPICDSLRCMNAERDAVLDDMVALKEALAAERARGVEIAAELAVARAKASEDSALIAQQKLQIAKLRHQIYGQRSERSSRLIEQLALTFEELEADATEDELSAEQAAARTTTVRGFTRKRAERQTFPEHLPRERVVINPPSACECCGGHRLRKIGADAGSSAATVEGCRDGAEEVLLP